MKNTFLLLRTDKSCEIKFYITNFSAYCKSNLHFKNLLENFLNTLIKV
jgi:hypothetical protein